jgi:hypothetical protein
VVLDRESSNSGEELSVEGDEAEVEEEDEVYGDVGVTTSSRHSF